MIGLTLAHYKVVSKLGEGGMGEVYRATDTKLNRDVALKILPEQFAADAQRMGRFQREAEVLASLTHPNIGAIYGIEDAGDTKALVLELIDGPTLAERIEAGPIAVDEAVPLALEICEALDAAHQKGIIHRDLKPANIKLTSEGKVKVLDFGLARAMEADPASSPDLTQSPTLSMAATQAGIILGTAGYMSPEQAKGKTADVRSDVWSFGAVLFEMLAGQRCFEGEDVTDTMAAVLRAEVEWDRLPAGTPRPIRRLLERCLERDLRRRMQAIGEARIVLEDFQAGAGHAGDDTSAPAPTAAAGLGSRAPWALAGALLVALLAGYAFWPQPVEAPLRKFTVLAEQMGQFNTARISPDGRMVAFGSEEGIWVRPLHQLEPRLLEGTEDGSGYFWSPDSRYLGFFRTGTLWKISVAEGSSSVVCDVPSGSNRRFLFGAGSWLEDGSIVFSGAGGLLQVSSDGGDAVLVLESQNRVRAYSSLPGDRGILAVPDDERHSVQIISGQQRRTILQIEGALLSDVVYSRTGHLVYSRGQTNSGIWAVPFSLDSLSTTGEDFLLTSEVGAPSVSADGTLVFRPNPFANTGGVQRQLVWVGLDGDVVERIGRPQVNLSQPVLSPDETLVAAQSNEGRGENTGGSDIWVHELRRGVRHRLTFTDGHHFRPFWHPDSKIVGYSRRNEGNMSLETKAANGTGQPAVLTPAGREADWSRDGRFVIFEESTDATADLSFLDTETDGKPQKFLSTPHSESWPRFSPDGALVAYESDASGDYQIFLRRFPPDDSQWQVSVAGGRFPLWSRDGSRLFYRQGPGLMAVDIDMTGEAPVLGNPQLAFSFEGTDLTGFGGNVDIASDGRFLVLQVVAAEDRGDTETQVPTIVVIENWFREFERTF